MSFRCQKCNEAYPQKSKPNIVVTEWYGGDGPKQIKREQRLCNKCAGKDLKPVALVEAPILTMREALGPAVL